jgi:hypothetical protein
MGSTLRTSLECLSHWVTSEAWGICILNTYSLPPSIVTQAVQSLHPSLTAMT